MLLRRAKLCISPLLLALGEACVDLVVEADSLLPALGRERGVGLHTAPETCLCRLDTARTGSLALLDKPILDRRADLVGNDNLGRLPAGAVVREVRAELREVSVAGHRSASRKRDWHMYIRRKQTLALALNDRAHRRLHLEPVHERILVLDDLLADGLAERLHILDCELAQLAALAEPALVEREERSRCELQQARGKGRAVARGRAERARMQQLERELERDERRGHGRQDGVQARRGHRLAEKIDAERAERGEAHGPGGRRRNEREQQQLAGRLVGRGERRGEVRHEAGTHAAVSHRRGARCGRVRLHGGSEDVDRGRERRLGVLVARVRCRHGRRAHDADDVVRRRGAERRVVVDLEQGARVAVLREGVLALDHGREGGVEAERGELRGEVAAEL
ncbi:uncharacterized protein LOC62_07G009685 [Vanrija pseudolonga]|uniref:Uncharacterized protein n=1 Tax=Vanrija pseudolonga TaxID=143232 RepID=A0AAF0YL95_9TREE|nr:hypothetical protein LOC62_07G009685 [Vanrija pseudolonga]